MNKYGFLLNFVMKSSPGPSPLCIPERKLSRLHYFLLFQPYYHLGDEKVSKPREIQIVHMPECTRQEVLQDKTAKLWWALVPFLAQGWLEIFVCGLSVDGLVGHYPYMYIISWVNINHGWESNNWQAAVDIATIGEEEANQ